MKSVSRRSPVWSSGLVLGAGLGGFVDGIVLHQILQWHHVLTSTPEHPATTVRGLEVNTLWDGVFHSATWALVAAGVAMLWRTARRQDVRREGRALCGWILVGWGLFNLVEGLIDHHILRIHHVRSGPDQLAYDIAFLVLGAVLVAGGLALTRIRATARG
jgi:uncharacterized membrane protein